VADQPNILLLFTDQQRFDTIAAAGYQHMLTPNLDRLVREGCYCRNAVTPNPVCMAARHYLLTGLPGRFHGYFGNRHAPIDDYSLPTLPRRLSEQGYQTFGIGKMHHEPPRMHHGYDELHLMEELPKFREEDAYASWLEEEGYGHVRHLHGCRHLLYHTPQSAQVPARLHGSSFVAERTIETIDRNRQRPWYIMASWVKPHPPWNVPAGWEHLYDGRDLPEPHPLARDWPYESEPSDWYGDHDSPEHRRAVRAAYYTHISLIDQAIGRVLDHLDSTGLADNTLVMFASDHGEMLYDRGFFQKGLPYEGSVRIPFLMRWPGVVEPGSQREDWVDLWDILPTAWDAAGLDAPVGDDYPGESLLTSAPQRDRTHAWSDYATGAGRWVSLRDQRYKLVHWFNGGHEELFDTVADPGEQTNLLKSGDAPAEVVERLRAKLIELEAARGPRGTVKEGAFADLPGKLVGPPGMGKYPLWAHQQFPTWGPLSKDLEAALMEQEILAATGGEFDDLLDSERWRKAWREGWAHLGGRPEFGDQILGEE